MFQMSDIEDDVRKNRKYSCFLCGKRFRFNSIFFLYMRIYIGEKFFKCFYCDYRAAQKGNFKIYLRIYKLGNLGKGRGRVREENRLLYELEERVILRDKQMKSSLLQFRFDLKFLSYVQQVFLVICNLVLFVNYSVFDVVNSVFSFKSVSVQEDSVASVVGFRCIFCKGKFKKREELDRYIRILYKFYKCTLCDFAVLQEEEFISYVEKAYIIVESVQGQGFNSGGEQSVNEFRCEVCGQVFSQAWFFKGYMRKYKDFFEYCCQICGRRFKEFWFFKNYMKVYFNKLFVKSKFFSDFELFVFMGGMFQEVYVNLYFRYFFCLQSGFMVLDKVGLSEFSQFYSKGELFVKEKEVLGKLLFFIFGMVYGVFEGDKYFFLGCFNFVSSLKFSCMERLQVVVKVVEMDSVNSYQVWQFMVRGMVMEYGFLFKEYQLQRNYEDILVNVGVLFDKEKREYVLVGVDGSKQKMFVDLVYSIKVGNSRDLLNKFDFLEGSRDFLLYGLNQAFEYNLQGFGNMKEKFIECSDCGRVFRIYYQVVVYFRVYKRDRKGDDDGFQVGLDERRGSGSD